MDVGEGEIVGLVGPNGAGKSTTLAAIVGLVPVASGKIAYLSESLVGVSTDAIARRGIALVLEGRHIFGTLTVAENLLLGRTANPDRRRADAVLESFEDEPLLVGETTYTSECHVPVGRSLLMIKYEDGKPSSTGEFVEPEKVPSYPC